MNTETFSDGSHINRFADGSYIFTDKDGNRTVFGVMAHREYIRRLKAGQ